MKYRPTFSNNHPFPETSLKGYILPQTCHFISKEQTFSKSQKKFFLEESINKSPEPSPTSYSPTFDQTKKKYWISDKCSFPKESKETLTSKILKKTQSQPGPGQYFPSIHKAAQQSPIAVFGKSRRPGLFENEISAAEEVPSSHSYVPHKQKNKKNLKRHAAYHEPNAEKNERSGVGPGSYNPDISLDKHVLKNSIYLGQSKADRLIRKGKKNLNKSDGPGVGTYDLSLGNISSESHFSGVKAFISPYKFLRMTEEIMKIKGNLPGPSHYNVGRVLKGNKDNESEYSDNSRKKKFIREV